MPRGGRSSPPAGPNRLALLRGINVGGANKVEMARLRQAFEELGFTEVRTYINSGNVVFNSPAGDERRLVRRIEKAIEEEFGFRVPVVLWDVDRLQRLVKAIPAKWVDDKTMRCYVVFLWPEVDRRKVLDELPFDPKIEDVRYLGGAVVWRIDRRNVTRSRMTKMVGTDLYRKLSMRSVNTVRKLYALMRPSPSG